MATRTAATKPQVVGSGWRVARRGYILLIIIILMLVIGILGFSLNFFKRGAIEQLSRTVDQNRLMLVAQAAATEVIARYKTGANIAGTPAFAEFREVFSRVSNPSSVTPTSPCTIEHTFALTDLPVTRKLVSLPAVAAYGINVTCRARIVSSMKVNRIGLPVYLGFLEVLASVKDRQNISFEIVERREIRQADMRDFFDKYALYLKCFSPSLNNPNRLLTIVPVTDYNSANLLDPTPENVLVSRVYLGTFNYPPTQDPFKAYYLDLCFNNGVDNPHAKQGKELIKALFGNNTGQIIMPKHSRPDGSLTDEPSIASDKYPTGNPAGPTKAFFVANPKAFPSIPNMPVQELWKYSEVHSLYLRIVQAAKQAQAGTNPDVANSVADFIVDDYNQKYRNNNLAGAQVFQAVVQTFYSNWYFRYAYVTADSVYNLANYPPSAFTTFVSTTGCYRGISSYPNDAPDYINGQYCNPGKHFAGRMPCLYGTDGTRPVLIEGNANLRFFKLGWYDKFTTNLARCVPSNINANQTVEFPVPETPLFYAWPARASGGNQAELLSKTRPVDTVSGGLLNANELESPLMSRPIDWINANRVLAGKAATIKVIATGSVVSYNTRTDTPHMANPSSKSGADGKMFWPAVSDEAFSQYFVSAEEFHRKCVVGDTMYVDGRVRINTGKLDLKGWGVKQYRGNGMIFVGAGDCHIGSLRADTAFVPYSRLRIFLQGGHFVVTEDNAVIEASLCAMVWPALAANGPTASLRMTGLSKVTIKGNLCLDVLNLDDMAANGQLIIVHTVDIFNPMPQSHPKMTPYRITVSPNRTLFAVNAGNRALNTP